jgi:hypothetical protein
VASGARGEDSTSHEGTGRAARFSPHLHRLVERRRGDGEVSQGVYS